jgi:DNA-binding NarL/FixJ family response regulator
VTAPRAQERAEAMGSVTALQAPRYTSFPRSVLNAPPITGLTGAGTHQLVSRADTVTVVVGRCEPILSLGLAEVLHRDAHLRVLDFGLDEEALKRAISRQAPRVAVLDETYVVDLSSLRNLAIASPSTRIVVLAHRPIRSYSMRLFAAGATCVPKDAAPEALLETVHRVASSEVPAAGVVALTRRQVTVLKHLCEGKSYAEIASALGISSETVRTHASQIRRQLGVKHKRELIGMPLPISIDYENNNDSCQSGAVAITSLGG